jgi:hypothetical protein
VLERRFANDPRVRLETIDLERPHRADHSSMISFNVLEHIEDDVQALASAGSLLRPGGRVFHFVPAFPFAYSRFDDEIGHFRRYTRQSMADKAQAAGLVDVSTRYVNAPGLLAWFVMMRLLGRRPAAGPMLTMWDSGVIPVVRRVESKVRSPFGQSLVLRAATPG